MYYVCISLDNLEAPEVGLGFDPGGPFSFAGHSHLGRWNRGLLWEAPGGARPTALPPRSSLEVGNEKKTGDDAGDV